MGKVTCWVLCPEDIIKCQGTLLAIKLLQTNYRSAAITNAKNVTLKFLPIKPIFPLHYIIEQDFDPAAAVPHWLLDIGSPSVPPRDNKTAIYRFTFCLPSSSQSVLTHCPSNLISHAAFKWRSRPWPLQRGWQLSDTDSGLQILAAKPSHSLLLQVIGHSLESCFTVGRFVGKGSTYCISKVSHWDKGKNLSLCTIFKPVAIY